MIGVLEKKGEAYGDANRRRKPFMDAQDVEKGEQLRAKIYAGVGNSGIFSLMGKYFPDFCEFQFSMIAETKGIVSWVYC